MDKSFQAKRKLSMTFAHTFRDIHSYIHTQNNIYSAEQKPQHTLLFHFVNTTTEAPHPFSNESNIALLKCLFPYLHTYERSLEYTRELLNLV